MKPEQGEIWENIHTKKKTTILGRLFFNIHHQDIEDEIGIGDMYTHYRKFQKHWRKV